MILFYTRKNCSVKHIVGLPKPSHTGLLVSSSYPMTASRRLTLNARQAIAWIVISTMQSEVVATLQYWLDAWVLTRIFKEKVALLVLKFLTSWKTGSQMRTIRPVVVSWLWMHIITLVPFISTNKTALSTSTRRKTRNENTTIFRWMSLSTLAWCILT